MHNLPNLVLGYREILWEDVKTFNIDFKKLSILNFTHFSQENYYKIDENEVDKDLDFIDCEISNPYLLNKFQEKFISDESFISKVLMGSRQMNRRGILNTFRALVYRDGHGYNISDYCFDLSSSASLNSNLRDLISLYEVLLSEKNEDDIRSTGITRKKELIDFLVNNNASRLSNFLDLFFVTWKKTISVPRFPSDDFPVLESDSLNITEEYIINKMDNNTLFPKNTTSQLEEVIPVICSITPLEFDYISESFETLPVTDPLFQNQVFFLLVSYIWDNRTKRVFRYNLFCFLLYLILVCLNLLWIFPNRVNNLNSIDSDFTKVSIALNIVIISFLLFYFLRNELVAIKKTEMKTLRKKVQTHFSNFWNILDFLVIILGVLSNTLDLILIFQAESDLCGSNLEKSVKVLNSIFLFVTWTRILDFARGFKSTSVLIRLWTQVAQDMRAFLIGLFYIVIGFSFSGKFY